MKQVRAPLLVQIAADSTSLWTRSVANGVPAATGSRYSNRVATIRSTSGSAASRQTWFQPASVIAR